MHRLIVVSLIIFALIPASVAAGGLGAAFSKAVREVSPPSPPVRRDFNYARGETFKRESPAPQLNLGPGGSNQTPSVAQPLNPPLRLRSTN